MRRSSTKASTIALNVFCTISLVCNWVNPISSEIVRTISFLVTAEVSCENGVATAKLVGKCFLPRGQFTLQV